MKSKIPKFDFSSLEEKPKKLVSKQIMISKLKLKDRDKQKKSKYKIIKLL